LKQFLKYLPLFALIAVSCGKDEFTPIDPGYDYYPLRKGFYQIYEIDSTGYSQVSEPVNQKYQIKVEVTDSFPSAQSVYTYVLARSIRKDEAASWRNLDTWSVRVEGDELIVNEGNRPYLKLTFPIRAGNSWDGNRYNNLVEDEYELTESGKSFTTTDGIAFEHSLTVQQEFNDDPIVFQDLRKEVYARGVGMVYKEVNQLVYCTDDPCLGQQIIESGMIYQQEIIEYGKQ
jgi:hypothetical protein